jgi:hypothetical protein
MRVLARAYGDRPLDRVAVRFEKKVTFIAAQSVASAMQPGELGGIGFPRENVFTFDAELFESLEGAWSDGDGETLSRLWAKATPLLEPDKIAA